MSEPTLAERLKAARARSFVGRAGEVELFTSALATLPPPFSLLWLHGPGGIGKSTLLRRLADEAQQRGEATVLIDARHVEITPEGFRRSVRPAQTSGRIVLMIDTAEALRPLDAWLREEYLPQLPDSSLVVLAGRDGPDDRWRADLGWSEQLQAVALRNLEPDAATTYLDRRGVPSAEVAEVLDLTHGHPLAMALLADVIAQQPASATSAASKLPRAAYADIVTTLLERFVGDVPDPVHRTALHVLGHARVTTMDLLRTSISDERAGECFAWLRSLSFVQTDALGLVPHDLARNVLDDDLRWRDRQAWHALRRRLREHYLQRATHGTGRERARAVADLLWFNRDSPVLHQYESWDAAFVLWWQQAGPDDLDQILQLVAGHEGPESVRLHQLWWQHQPEAFCVIRDRPGRVHGFFVQLRLDASAAASPALTEDPFARNAFEYIARTAPLRPGEHLRVIRSWIGRDGYHLPTATHQTLTGATTATWLSEAGLAVSVAYMSNPPADPQLWAPMFEHVDYAPVPPADVDFAGRHYAAYLHDWRLRPPLEWLEAFGGRREDAPSASRGTAVARPALMVLSRPEFDSAVRDAFRGATRASALAGNPLLRSRVVRDRAPQGEAAQGEAPRGEAAQSGEPTPAQLRAVLLAAVARLAADPRRQRSARALEVTYLKPAATQEAAAARLSMPFSTYRRHLAAGLAAVSDDLWDGELHGTPKDLS